MRRGCSTSAARRVVHHSASAFEHRFVCGFGSGSRFGSACLGGSSPSGNARCTRSAPAVATLHRTRSAWKSTPASPSAPTVPRMYWSAQSTTPDEHLTSECFRVVHPYHPLFGREFRVADYRHNWGQDRVYFHNPTGVLTSIPTGWTSLFGSDGVCRGDSCSQPFATPRGTGPADRGEIRVACASW